MFLRIFAWALSLVFATLEDVYNSRFVDTAVGHSLFNIGRSIGLWVLPSQKANGYLTITGTDGVAVPAGFLAATNAGIQYVVLKNGIIDGGSVTVPAQCVTTGPDGNTPAGTIKNIVTPLDGLEKVTNGDEFIGGRDRENTPEYRKRYYKSVDFAGGVNADAIRAEILTVDGVLSAEVYENDTDETDIYGLTPHSIEAVVHGGQDTSVARAIFRRKAAGIQTIGTVEVPVLSDSGNHFYDIRFNRPDLVPVWVRIWGLVTDPSVFPLNGTDLIKQAMVNYIGGSAAGGLSIGVDVYYKRLPDVVYTVPGVLDFEMKIGTDGDTWSYQNIEVSTRQKAVCDTERVVFDGP